MATATPATAHNRYFWHTLFGNPPGPPPAGWWHRTGARLLWLFVMPWRHLHNRWLLSRGNRSPRRWWRPRRWLPVTTITVLALLYLAWLISSLVLLATNESGWHWYWINPQGKDPAYQQTFNVLFSVILTIAGGALSTVGWLAWRYNRVRWSYQRRARTDAAGLVKAGSIATDEVVGRDQLCDALMRDLSSKRRRRPHVVVGTLGLGKTALLVRLTQMLVRKGAVPVPIQLRTVQDAGQLDFEELAHKAFCEAVQYRLVSDAEGDKVWRRLRKLNDKIVVLADGLEETLRDKEDRDTNIRRALNKAKDDRLPLVITSRPQAALRGLDAALTELEPLNPDDAACYIYDHSTWRGQADERQIDALVQAAQVTESPLYLHIATQLQEHELLENVFAGIGNDADAPEDRERWAVRYDLLEQWVQALEDGWLAPELPLSKLERKAAIEYTSALACIGLLNDCALVKFAELEMHPKQGDEKLDDIWLLLLRASHTVEHRAAYAGAHEGMKYAGTDGEVLTSPACDEICQALKQTINEDSKLRVDKRVAATWADQMGLVEASGGCVRFEHTILQAYLGSRYLDSLFRADSRKALVKSLRDPGRELIMALVLYSRNENLRCACENSPDLCPIRAAVDLLAGQVLETLRLTKVEVTKASVEDPNDGLRKCLEMYAAALEIDSVDCYPHHERLVRDISGGWENLQGYDQQKLEQSKINLVRRIGVTSRLVAETRCAAGYKYLVDMAGKEESYPVRYAIGEEIGSGGNAAYDEVRAQLEENRPSSTMPLRDRHESQGTGIPAAVAARSDMASEARPGTPRGGDRYRRKTRLQDRRQLQDAERQAELDERDRLQQDWRKKVLCAWLSPLLVESCDYGGEEERSEGRGKWITTPYANLHQWVSAVCDRPDGTPLDLTLQIALAQGFKQAANRRLLGVNASEKRGLLSGQATELLGKCGFWFTRLTLLHALTLWELRENFSEEQPMRGHGSSARKQVGSWLAHKPKGMGPREHPLVAAAGWSARHALQTRRPDHFVWIDEAGLITRIGSRTRLPRNPRQDYWIAPSTGWSTLEPSAQQLLADVLVMQALTDERGDSPQKVVQRLTQIDRRDQGQHMGFLPPCMIKDRGSLAPRSPAVLAKKPGSTCLPECDFHLCPYPSKGPDCRVEFSEMFCIQQRSLYDRLQPAAWVRLRFRRKGRWQRHISVAEQRRSWDEMTDRACNIPLEHGSVRSSATRDTTP